MTVRMQNRNLLATLAGTVAVLGAAIRAAAAVEEHRRPDAATLRTLGIEPNAFPMPM